MSYVKVSNAFLYHGIPFSVECAEVVEAPGIPRDSIRYAQENTKKCKYSAVIDTTNSPDAIRKKSKLRIFFHNMNDVVSIDGIPFIIGNEPAANATVQLSDEELTEIIEDKFFSVNKFAEAASKKKIRSLLVSGTAGTGKTYEVMTALENEERSNRKFSFSVVKGTISPIALYIELYNCRDSVLVLDDCDNALMENESLQLLKAATESHKTRRISYKKMSKALEDYGIPQEFNFEGSVIILTNTDLEKGGKTRLPHFEAIISRAHYINAVLRSDREKLLRIRSVIRSSDILKTYLKTDEEKQDVIDFIEENYSQTRELSVRTVVKIAELRAAFPDCWRKLANATIKK